MLELILSLAVLGAIVYMVITYIPMPAPFKTIILVIVVICLLVYLIRLFGLDIPLPRR